MKEGAGSRRGEWCFLRFGERLVIGLRMEVSLAFLVVRRLWRRPRGSVEGGQVVMEMQYELFLERGGCCYRSREVLFRFFSWNIEWACSIAVYETPRGVYKSRLHPPSIYLPWL